MITSASGKTMTDPIQAVQRAIRRYFPPDVITNLRQRKRPVCRCHPRNTLYWELSGTDTSDCPLHGPIGGLGPESGTAPIGRNENLK